MRTYLDYLGVGILLILSGFTVAQEPGLNVTVQIKGSTLQQYKVASGESFFIPTSPGALQPATPKQPDALDQKKAQVAQKVAAKVTEIQNKQRELDNEIYPLYKTQLEIDRQNLEKQLRDLQAEQAKLDSEKTIQELNKKKQEAAQAQNPTVVSGVQVKPTFQDDKVELAIQSQNIQNTILAPLGTWVPLTGIQPEIWVKVDAQ